MTTITTRKLNSIRPKLTPFFLRDSNVTGFGVKANPAGAIKFIAEVSHEGKSTPKTLGDPPIISVSEARSEAISFINEVRQGKLISQKTQQTLEELFGHYICHTGLNHAPKRTINTSYFSTSPLSSHTCLITKTT